MLFLGLDSQQVRVRNTFYSSRILLCVEVTAPWYEAREMFRDYISESDSIDCLWSTSSLPRELLQLIKAHLQSQREETQSAYATHWLQCVLVSEGNQMQLHKEQMPWYILLDLLNQTSVNEESNIVRATAVMLMNFLTPGCSIIGSITIMIVRRAWNEKAQWLNRWFPNRPV